MAQKIFNYMRETSKEVDEYIGEIFETEEKHSDPFILHLINVRCDPKNVKPKILPAFGRLSLEYYGVDNWQKYVPLLAAYELETISCYILDDLLDSQDFRESKLSTHKVYGKNIGVLTSFLIHNISQKRILKLEEDEKKLNVIINLWGNALNSVYKGQILSEKIMQDKYDADLNKYLDRCYMLAGKPLETIFNISSKIKSSSGSESILLADFGKYYGIACQIRNDLVDFVPSDIIKQHSLSLSKENFEDVRKGLMTYSVICGLKTEYRNDIVTAIEANEFQLLNEILSYSGSINNTVQLINTYRNKCNSYLEKLRDSDPKNYLIEMVENLGNVKKYFTYEVVA